MKHAAIRVHIMLYACVKYVCTYVGCMLPAENFVNIEIIDLNVYWGILTA